MSTLLLFASIVGAVVKWGWLNNAEPVGRVSSSPPSTDPVLCDQSPLPLASPRGAAPPPPKPDAPASSSIAPISPAAEPLPEDLIYREDELLVQLRNEAPELRIDNDGKWTSSLFPPARSPVVELKSGPPDPSRLRELVRQRDDLAGLPFQFRDGCQIEGERLNCLAEVSRTINGSIRLPTPSSTMARPIVGFSISSAPRSPTERMQAILDRLGDSQQWNKREHVAALEQTLQVEGEMIVLAMVDALSRIEGREATQALARRALYDVSSAVRAKAIDALRTRGVPQYRDALTAGLRYPWAPVSIHAAEALVRLDVKEVAPRLIRMLEEPPPTAPQRDVRGRMVVRELVKVNHLRNCALCHAPATPDSFGSFGGLVPTPGEKLPVNFYGEIGGASVRADATYLRQDFSVMESVVDAAPWPSMQRFDFLVRTRVLSVEERAQLEASSWENPGSSSHRQALLYALRGLTGKDGGDDPQRWRELVGLVR
ncbi:MAG: HEAT repeat domain-containing protein [Pirellulaceae bacterium]